MFERFFWIPVRKRTPKIGRTVLVTTILRHSRLVYTGYIHAVSGKWCTRNGAGSAVPGEVIAWRAMPGAYRGSAHG